MGTMINNIGVTPLAMVQKWQFSVEIDGFSAAYFTKASLPEVEWDEVKFSPGGSIFDQKAQGRVKFADTTLEMGHPADGTTATGFMEWLNLCLDVTNNVGGCVPSDYMKDIDIVTYTHCGEELQRFRLHNAFPKTLKLGDVEGGSSDNIIASLTLCYNYFTME